MSAEEEAGILRIPLRPVLQLAAAQWFRGGGAEIGQPFSADVLVTTARGYEDQLRWQVSLN